MKRHHNSRDVYFNPLQHTKGPDVVCVYCDWDHQSASCKVIPDTETQKQHLEGIVARCFLCLKKFHIPDRPDMCVNT